MKIAVWHNLPSGGGKRALYYHVRGLVERGHKVECWSLSTADHSYLPLGEFGTEHIVPYQPKSKAPPPGARRLAGAYYEALGRLQAFAEACQQCAREIEAGAFDLLFANSSVLYYMPFVMRYVRIPKVLYLQEPFRPLYEANPMLPWVGGMLYDNVKGMALHPGLFLADCLQLHAMRLQAREEWANAQACDTLLVNSYYSRESILRVYGRDAKVCYLGIDTERFRHLHREREHMVVGLGSFDQIKGVDLAIKALALVAEPRPSLVWVANSGNQDYMAEMTALARSLGVALQIRMSVTDAELVETLNRAALLLYTSRLEPFGFAPLEANACATPVVAVAEGGVRETVREGINGFLADREPESIAAAIGRLLRDPSLARRMGEAAEQHVRQEWSVERSVDRLEHHLLRATAAASGVKERERVN